VELLCECLEHSAIAERIQLRLSDEIVRDVWLKRTGDVSLTQHICHKRLLLPGLVLELLQSLVIDAPGDGKPAALLKCADRSPETDAGGTIDLSW